MKTPATQLCAFLVSVGLAAPGSPAVENPQQQPRRVEAVAELDLNEYAGRWFEISRFPNWFQDDCAGEVLATYRLREEGGIDAIAECTDTDGGSKQATGVAKLASKDGPASKLKVRFAPKILSWLPFVWADYWVLALNDEYTHVAVGTPNRKYLWILSRTRQMDERDYEAVVGQVAAMGFAVERLVRTRQATSRPCPALPCTDR